MGIRRTDEGPAVFLQEGFHRIAEIGNRTKSLVVCPIVAFKAIHVLQDLCHGFLPGPDIAGMAFVKEGVSFIEFGDQIEVADDIAVCIFIKPCRAFVVGFSHCIGIIVKVSV